MAEAACDRMRRSNLLDKREAMCAPQARYFGGMTPSFSVMTVSRSGCRRPFLRDAENRRPGFNRLASPKHK
jgi:hypothetical protein